MPRSLDDIRTDIDALDECIVRSFFDGFSPDRNPGETLTAADIEKFGTPNSARVIQFISKQSGKIIVSRKAVEQIQSDLNRHGHRSLEERIQRIRA